jgi:hypothetical protein
MAFFDYLESLRQKPDHIKQRIVFGVVGGLMAIIIGAWLMSLSYTLSLDTKPKDEKEYSESPFVVVFSSLKGSIEAAISSFRK